MAENSAIEWTDATGRRLGALKTAAKRCGCTVDEWIEQRRSGRRRCFRCQGWKPADQFSKDRSRGDGLTSSCKECTSDASTASRYGMSLADLHAFRAHHQHQCGICSAKEILYIDHDHATGRPRGLLCPACNSAIGLLGEDPARFAAALAYLQRAGQPVTHDGFPEVSRA